MSRTNLCQLFLFLLGLVASSGQSTPTINTGFRPMPAKPIRLNKPQNFTAMTRAECPSECTSNGCCTNAWDAMSLVASSMPMQNCTFCQALRFAMDRMPRDEVVKCQDCLMEDFKRVITQFRCQNDNGRCSKCCMDLSLIYVSRFDSGCPTSLWRTVANFTYENTGAVYDGSSSCPAYSPSPVPGAPVVYTNMQDLIERTLSGPAPPLPTQDDYIEPDNMGVITTAAGENLLTPQEVLEIQQNGGIAG